MSEERERPVAEQAGRARELVRGPRRARRPDETGRQHHLGAAPADMPVLGGGDTGPDGPAPRTTRTTRVQLADRTRHELALLERSVKTEMERAAADLDFESAAWHRDELDRVRAEVHRRETAGGA
jgi:hypothetical protein